MPPDVRITVHARERALERAGLSDYNLMLAEVTDAITGGRTSCREPKWVNRRHRRRRRFKSNPERYCWPDLGGGRVWVFYRRRDRNHKPCVVVVTMLTPREPEDFDLWPQPVTL